MQSNLFHPHLDDFGCQNLDEKLIFIACRQANNSFSGLTTQVTSNNNRAAYWECLLHPLPLLIRGCLRRLLQCVHHQCCHSLLPCLLGPVLVPVSELVWDHNNNRNRYKTVRLPLVLHGNAAVLVYILSPLLLSFPPSPFSLLPSLSPSLPPLSPSFPPSLPPSFPPSLPPSLPPSPRSDSGAFPGPYTVPQLSTSSATSASA